MQNISKPFLKYSETRLLRTLKGNEKRYVLNKVRLSKTKKGQKRPIGDVRDRRRERNNRMYELSQVRTNRVSLYWWGLSYLLTFFFFSFSHCTLGAVDNNMWAGWWQFSALFPKPILGTQTSQVCDEDRGWREMKGQKDMGRCRRSKLTQVG